MTVRLDVSDILDKISQGKGASEAHLEKVGEAAAGLRDDFLRDAFQAAATLTPYTAGFEAFKNCLKSVIDLLMRHGFVSPSEIQLLLLKIEEREK